MKGTSWWRRDSCRREARCRRIRCYKRL